MLQRAIAALKRVWDVLPEYVRVLLLSWLNHQLYRLMVVVQRLLEAHAPTTV